MKNKFEKLVRNSGGEVNETLTDLEESPKRKFNHD